MSELPVDADQLPATMLYLNSRVVHLESLPGTLDIPKFLIVFLSPCRKNVLQYFD
jgi:hypothetical protein